jgi:pullulanase
MVFMHSGQEFCRTKQGSHNSYNLPDEINRIDWLRKKEFADVVAYHRGLIALRKAHPALRLASAAAVRKRVTFPAAPNDQSIVYRIDSAGVEGEAATEILVLLNGAVEPTRFSLPLGGWKVHADANQAAAALFGEASGEVTLPAHSGMFLTR